MLHHRITPRLRAVFLAVIPLLACAGCSREFGGGGGGSFGGSNRVPQSQEMDWAPPLRMKVERCYWSNTFDRFGGLRGATPMPESVRQQMLAKAQDAYLAVDVALTNYGTSPLATPRIPLFELKSRDGRLTFQPDQQGMGGLTQQMGLGGSNINPGRALHGPVAFDVPPGEYDLLVYVGENRGGAIFKTGLAWIWELAPEASK